MLIALATFDHLTFHPLHAGDDNIHHPLSIHPLIATIFTRATRQDKITIVIQSIIMLDERELALKPIVGESVGHNARVSSSPLSARRLSD